MLIDTVTLVTPGTETADAEGNPVEATPSTQDYRGWLQQKESVEVVGARTVVTSKPFLFLEPDAPLTSANRVRVNGSTYEVDGEPNLLRTPRGPHHWEADLLRVT